MSTLADLTEEQLAQCVGVFAIPIVITVPRAITDATISWKNHRRLAEQK